MSETPLSNVPGWLPEHVQRLGSSWITSAEQVVSLAATPGGIRSISEQLELSRLETERLVDAARAKLPPDVQQKLRKPVDVSDFGLGAIPPADKPGTG